MVHLSLSDVTVILSSAVIVALRVDVALNFFLLDLLSWLLKWNMFYCGSEKKNTHLIKSLRLSEKICYILTHKNLILFLVQKLIKNTVINGTWKCERVWGSVGGSTCSIIESELN